MDIQSAKRDKCIQALQKVYGTDNVVRVCTFGTEKAKSAIQTACRSLGVDVDIANYLSSMVNGERGIQYTLAQVFYGDEEKDLKPNTKFVEEMTKNYPQVWEIAQGIEGLIKSVGIHAGGVIIVDEPFSRHNAIMKTRAGDTISQFELHDSEKVGQIKIDLLATEATDKIRACLDLLVEYGYVEKKNSLRETYESVIGTYVLERNAPEMWQMVLDNKITSLFQMEKDSGVQGIAMARPKTVDELAILNSVIRLMAPEKGGEQPLVTWSRYREDIEQWYREMKAYGLTLEEIELLANHSGIVNGMCVTQEGMMMLVQQPQIAGMSLAWADKCRKAIAKKVGKLLDECEKEYYQAVEKNNCSKKLASYVWQVLLRVQRGYSFNLAHTFSYSIVALQEMNLAYRFPTIYWNCANLIVDSGSAGLNKFQDEPEEPAMEEDDDDDEKKSARSVDYGKISMAIGRMRGFGIEVELPDINESQYTFTPNDKTGVIRYGIKGIARIGDALVDEIILNRPYFSLADFLMKIKVNKTQVVNLIKSGCFDKVEELPREAIMHNYLASIAETKSKLTLQNMPFLIRNELLPEDMEQYARLFNFNKHLKTKKSGLDYLLGVDELEFYSKTFDVNLLSDVGGQWAIRQKDWDKMYTKAMVPMRDYLKDTSNNLLARVNEFAIAQEREKYAAGSVAKWEMDSVGFYHTAHELDDYYQAGEMYGLSISNFNDLSENPVVRSMFRPKNSNSDIAIYELYHIAGTVIQKDKTKHSVMLLCNNEVVNVKVWDSQFTKYDKQISEKLSDGKKHVLEKSWFTRGNKLFVTGIRRGNAFVPKLYRSQKDVDVPIILLDDDMKFITSRCDEK